MLLNFRKCFLDLQLESWIALRSPSSSSRCGWHRRPSLPYLGPPRPPSPPLHPKIHDEPHRSASATAMQPLINLCLCCYGNHSGGEFKPAAIRLPWERETGREPYTPPDDKMAARLNRRFWAKPRLSGQTTRDAGKTQTYSCSLCVPLFL